MSASSQERTEQATPKRLRDARREGQVASSRDLAAAAMLIAGLGALAWRLPTLGRALQSLMERVFQGSGAPHAVILTTCRQPLQEIAVSIGIVMAACCVASIGATAIQVGGLVTTSTLEPKLERLDPMAGLKRLFGRRSFVELFKHLVKVVVVVALCAGVVQNSLGGLTGLGSLPLGEAMSVVAGVAGTCLIRVLTACAFIAGLDVFYQRWEHRRGLRMTKQEVLREYKQEEGDPHVRGQRRQLREEFAMAGMLAQVRAKADVVIRNPTHLACALHYMPDGRGSPPKLIGKGKGWLAEQLVRAAREEGIPMLHDVPLARSLFRLDQDAFIPPELYEAVIEVLHWAEEVAEQRGRKVRWKEVADVCEPGLSDAAAPSLPDYPSRPMAKNLTPPLGDEPLPSLKPSLHDPRPGTQATRSRDQR